jgi:hypothetical protein
MHNIRTPELPGSVLKQRNLFLQSQKQT